LRPLAADSVAATLLLPSSLPPTSLYLIWPERDGRRGAPIAINRTEAWWLGPDSAVPGTTISVFGRNLSRSNGTTTSYIYIQRSGEAGEYVPPTAVNPFKVDFKVPDLAPGAYEVWVHNGHGGDFGWSGPLALKVLAHSPWAGQDRHVIDVKSYGAAGDGAADDTAAIKAALAAAADAAPATVRFPAGTYLVTAPLEAPSNVRWLGDGMDKSVFRLEAPLQGSMIFGALHNARFQALTLDANGMTGGEPLLAIPSVTNLRLDAVRLKAWGVPALQSNDSSGLYINASELIENGSFYGNSRQIFMTDNRFRMTGYGESVVALWGGSDLAMIGNDLANADESRDDGHGIGRFFVAQSHRGTVKNLYFGRNVSHNAAPHDCSKVDCNKGEQICFEMAGGDLLGGFEGATATTASFRKLAFSPVPSGRDLIVVGGRGAGQHRHIVSSDGAMLHLDRPWRVIPDASSRFAIAGAAYHAAIYNNTFQGRASYDKHDSDSTAVLLYGNVYDSIVDHNHISRMRHGMMTVALASSSGMSPYFLQYSNNTVTDSNSGLYVGTTFADSGVAGVWGGLGNIYRDNTFDNLAHIGVEYESWQHDGGDYDGTVFAGNKFTDLPYGFIDAFHLMWTYNGAFQAPPKHSSRKYNTILYRNSFRRGTARYKGSVGFKSLQPDNTWVNIGSTWTGFASGNEGPTAKVR
ncbi:MAG TPA: glycosyl hydrolase family 28-related protein, partial [Pararhizobium sp.]|nr:glycosyl hydrolase family 28-related protein [Pararhizobium sp.]